MRIIFIFFLFGLVSPVLRAVETPPVAEVFVCTLNAGKTMAEDAIQFDL